MSTYRFTLMIDGDVEEHLDELFDAGCDDASFGEVDGIRFADFSRDAAGLAEAVSSAIAAIEGVDGLRVTRMAPDDLVTIAEIAQRLGRSRESVRLLVTGARGPGDFPSPVSHLRTRSRLWRWSDVAIWAGHLGPEEAAQARFLAAINAALELRSSAPGLRERERALVTALGGAA